MCVCVCVCVCVCERRARGADDEVLSDRIFVLDSWRCGALIFSLDLDSFLSLEARRS